MPYMIAVSLEMSDEPETIQLWYRKPGISTAFVPHS